jgi:hypothetical protein
MNVKIKKLAAALLIAASALSMPVLVAPVAASVPRTTDGATLYAWIKKHDCPSCAYKRLSWKQKQAVKHYETPNSYVRRPGPRRACHHDRCGW